MGTYHRTAKFKVHNPSGRKLRRVKKMQAVYSSAFVDALQSMREFSAEELEEFSSASQTKAKRRIEEALGDQPMAGAMWDGLVADLQWSITTYLETPGAKFPAPSSVTSTPIEDLLGLLTQPMSREEEEILKAELRRKSVDYTRPIHFARFRDCPILRSDDGTKLWVAPHLQARDDGAFGALPAKAQSVRPGTWQYSSSTHHRCRQKNKECLPIECSRWHMYRFFRSGTPCSARVRVRNDEIWIHYAFTFETGREVRREHTAIMGVDRGEAITAAYAVLDTNGGVLEEGSSADEKLRCRLKRIDNAIRERDRQGASASDLYRKRKNYLKSALHRIANRIVDTAHRHNAAISFENLRNLRGNGRGGRLTRRQFRRLMRWTQYKAQERGIRADITVSPAYTSRTCPECGHCEKGNRPTRDRFVCRSCGHEAHADINAGRMIATRALWDTNGREKENGCQNLIEYTQMLAHRRTKGTLGRSWQVSSPSSDASGST